MSARLARLRPLTTRPQVVFRRYATARDAYVPSKAKVEARRDEPLALPSTSTFFSGRAALLDTVYALETQCNQAKRALHLAHLTPLPESAKRALPPLRNRWLEARDMYQMVGANLSTSQYRRVVRLLVELSRLRQIAQIGGRGDLHGALDSIVSPFEKPSLNLGANDGKRKPVVPDEHGRAYAMGRRKTSSARVWAIKIQPEAKAEAEARGEIATAEVLINGMPASTYFPRVADREKVFRPLELGGLLTAYNVFALVRGGGRASQAQAVSTGMAKALYALEPRVGGLMAEAALTRRDPRMVERKKTNRAKARKGYGWVKR